MVSVSKASVKLIAYYLPQFHAIPENDLAWGKGFTEWTNVKQAEKLYNTHYQPHIPAKDIGYYDLLADEDRLIKQAALAQDFGIYGFCYYYYWFDGRRVLEKPLERMLKAGKPDFPFCLCWANENWTRRWDGSENEIIIPQDYQRVEDIAKDLIPYFKDPRYIKIDGRPLWLIYKPGEIPHLEQKIRIWRATCEQQGVPNPYICACLTADFDAVQELGFDGAAEFPPHGVWTPPVNYAFDLPDDFEGRVYDYEAVVTQQILKPKPPFTVFRGAMTGWDNTPRLGKRARIFSGSSPEAFESWLRYLVRDTGRRLPEERRFVFLNAWNEWAEGAHLEPDLRYGTQWLEACRRAVSDQGETGTDKQVTDDLLSAFPDNLHVRQAAIRHFLEFHETDKAADLAELALSEAGVEDRNFLDIAASALAEAGREDEALALAKRSASRQGAEAADFHRLGNLLARKEDWEQAAEAQSRVIELDPVHVSGYRQLASAKLRLDQPVIALELAKKALDLDPKSAGSHHHVGNLLARNGDWSGAVEAQRQAIALAPSHTLAHIRLAVALINLGQRVDALDTAMRAVNLAPNQAGIQRELGALLSKLNLWEQAASAQRLAVELDPTHLNAHIQLSNALSRLGQHDKALAAAERAAEIDPDNGEAYLSISNALMRLEKWAGAVAAQRKAVELGQTNIGSLQRLARSLLNCGEADQAIAMAEHVVQCGSADAETFFLYGSVLSEAGRQESAIEALEQATILDETHMEAQKSLARAFMEAGRTGDAISVAQNVVRLEPGSPGGYRFAGKLFAQAERWTDAVEIQSQGIEIAIEEARGSAHDFEGLTQLGGMLMVLGRWDEAIDVIQRAADLNPSDAVTLRELSVALTKSERLEEALSIAERLADLKPELNSRLRIGAILGRLGRWEEAVATYEKAIALDPFSQKAHDQLRIARKKARSWKRKLRSA